MELMYGPIPEEKKSQLEELLSDLLEEKSLDDIVLEIEKELNVRHKSPFHNRFYKLMTTVFDKTELREVLKSLLTEFVRESTEAKPGDNLAFIGGQGWEEAGLLFLGGLAWGLSIGSLLKGYGWGSSEESEPPPDDPDEYGENVGDFPITTTDGDSSVV